MANTRTDAGGSSWREKWQQLTRTSSGAPDEELHLDRSLSTFAVLLLAVGSVIGTGIFVILGVVIPIAGPAVVLSFILAGFACLLSGLSYAEIASSLPSSGSVYSYAYASVGELVAWIVGFTLAGMAIFLIMGLAVRVVGLLMAIGGIAGLALLRWGAFSP
ncbi:MAG TPA: amino acid permease, partial [Actinomycetota bacterium]|nr:amino acid permease [Actinomycetota bacterium]